MNQTTWIIGGGILIVILSAVLYTMSGTVPADTIVTSDTYQKSTTTAPDSQTGMPTITPVAPHGSTTMTDTTKAPATSVSQANTKSIVTLHTSMGDITMKLYTKEVPKTSANFIKLASSGFYDGVKFHRVIKGFMIQAGDPNSKDNSDPNSWGSGGPGYKFADEIDPVSDIYKRGYKHGVLAMANSGPNTNGSQFFIMAGDVPLPPAYAIFGEVTDGLDVVDAIDSVQTDGSAQAGTGHDRPLTPVVIKSVTVK